MTLLQELMTLLATLSVMLSSALYTIAPHQDPNGNLFLVNRDNMVSDAFEPEALEQAKVPGQVRQMKPEAAAALEEMFAACREETRKTLISVSGYRSVGKQTNIYKRKLRSVKGDVAKAQEYVAPPGASEHHTGLAMDIGQNNSEHLSVRFRDTEGGKWVVENCWKYGFILRYGEEWEAVTGYKYEPWHFRYVGKEYSEEITKADIPFETWLLGYRKKVLTELLKP